MAWLVCLPERLLLVAKCEGAACEPLCTCDRRKEDDNPLDDEVRGAIRSFCQGLVAAINKYYAFGSVFVDEAS